MREVVVTGLGLISPVGLEVESSWAAVLAGRSGVGPITRFDATGFETRIAAEVKGFDPLAYMDRKLASRTNRYCQFAIAATLQAVADAKLAIGDHNRDRVGVLIGSGVGGLETVSDAVLTVRDRGPRRVSPFAVPMFVPDMAAGHISILLGACGPNFAVMSACASSAHCLGEAAEMIRRGQADVVLAGGADAPLLPVTVAGFNTMRALSTRNDSPETASRPFDATRDGFVLGEGAAMLVLEAEAVARQRGARVLGRLVGYGATADAYHITAAPERGRGARKAMQLALCQAGLRPEAIPYINAHGTGTGQNDRAETEAIKDLFGEHAWSLAVSSTKSMTGHTLGAAGAIEAAFCLLALRDGILPPTTNLRCPDPACDLDYVPNAARRQAVRVAMSNSFGFGGHNACLIFARGD